MTQRAEFDLESKLLTVLEDEARSSVDGPFAKRGAELIVVRESSIGNTIPDLIVVRALHRRSASRRVKLTIFESWVVGELIRSGEMCEVALTRTLFTRVESTRSALAKLERLGIVRQSASGTYLVTTDFAKRFQVVSVEAKLTRWRVAIEQAKRYLRFSDESFVALPASVIARNRRIEHHCAAAGVGLIAVARGDVSVVLLPSPPVEPDRRPWTWLLAKTGALHV